MDKDYYRLYYSIEREHWWFRARENILRSIIEKNILPKIEGKPRILNIGAATGRSSEWLEKYGDLVSLEYDQACIEFVKDKTHIPIRFGDILNLDLPSDSFDLVCVFDVIEHVEDDQKAVAEIKRVLKKSGYFFITVPAYMHLWSMHDEVNHHFRRYTRKNLSSLFSKDDHIRVSYFNFILYPMILLSRSLNKMIKGKKQTRKSDFESFNPGGLMNKLLFRIFNSEKGILKNNIDFPWGVSLLLLGRKPN